MKGQKTTAKLDNNEELEELRKLLDDFMHAVDEADLTESKKINFFSVTKMLKLETKHSAFFSWLLEPDNEHKLKNTVLRKLLVKLYNYNTHGDKKTKSPDCNGTILKNRGVISELSELGKNQLIDLANSVKFNVLTEVTTHNGKRIDILIDIAETDTVIAIENKIDSTTHDNQLCEYEKYIDIKYSSYKNKIFIYLTKFGELPYNTDSGGKRVGPNKRWCSLDYGAIRCIIDEIDCELKSDVTNKIYDIPFSEKQTLITILEHYIQMVDKNILETNPEARDACKKILLNPKVKQAFDILVAYSKKPTPEQIADYACKALGGERVGESQFWFYTKAMEKYFVEKKNEPYEISKLKIVCQASDAQKTDSKIVMWCEMGYKYANGHYAPTQAQIDLANSIGLPYTGSLTRLLPSKEDGKKSQSFNLVLEKERGIDFEQLIPKLDERLKEFKAMLDELTSMYL